MCCEHAICCPFSTKVSAIVSVAHKDVNALLQREQEELHHPCMIATTQSCTSLTFLYTARLINLHASSSNKTNLNCERKSKW
jgi:hypothetical protein